MGETNSEDKARYDFKKDMQEITNYRGRGTELISVYVPASKQISDVMAYLRNEQSQASNIKSKTTTQDLQGTASERCRHILRGGPQGRGPDQDGPVRH